MNLSLSPDCTAFGNRGAVFPLHVGVVNIGAAEEEGRGRDLAADEDAAATALNKAILSRISSFLPADPAVPEREFTLGTRFGKCSGGVNDCEDFIGYEAGCCCESSSTLEPSVALNRAEGWMGWRSVILLVLEVGGAEDGFTCFKMACRSASNCC